MRYSVTLIFFIVISSNCYSQISEALGCYNQTFMKSVYVDELEHPQVYRQLNAFVASVFKHFGIPKNIYLIECLNFRNAVGDIQIENGRQYKVILYDPEWIVDIGVGDEWSQKGVIAHEMAHLIADHNYKEKGTKPHLELEADFFVGATFNHLGGTIENAISLFESTPVKGSRTHPPRQERVEWATRGWKSVENSTTLRGSLATGKTNLETKISSFTYKALVISNQNYGAGVDRLEFPNQDADKLKTILLKKYSFKEENIFHLKDATRDDIISALDSLAGVVTKNDNLLIFYAGHGVFDENLKKGYWLPVDADGKRKTNWVSNSDIQDYLVSFQSQHTLLISDACFSGSIFEFNQRKLSDKNKKVTSRLLEKKSRKAMTSGLNKPVPDESKFIKYLLKELEKNKKPYLTAGQLFYEIREAVRANTENDPQFEVIKNANHEGGEFVFFKSEE